MEMPKPTADHRKLEKFAGIWKGTETMHPSPWDPKGGEAQGITRARVALDGFAVIGDYEQTRQGKVTYQGAIEHAPRKGFQKAALEIAGGARYFER